MFPCYLGLVLIDWSNLGDYLFFLALGVGLNREASEILSLPIIPSRGISASFP
jgi:hypothetical protein